MRSLFFVIMTVLFGTSMAFAVEVSRDSLVNKIGLLSDKYSAEELDSMAFNNLSNNPAQSIIYCKAFLKEHAESSVDTLVANVNWTMSQAYRVLGEYDKSFFYLNEVLHVIEKRKDSIPLAAIYTDYAEIYHLIKDYDQCLQYFNRSLYIYEALNHTGGIMYAKGNIATIKGEIGETEYALKVLHAMSHYYQTENDTNAYLISISNISRLHIQNKDYQKAIDLLESKKGMFYEKGQSKHVLMMLLNLSQAYMDSRDFVNSELSLDSATAIVNRTSYLGEVELYLPINYIEHYKAKGDYKTAFEYQEEYELILDSIAAEYSAAKIDAYKLLFENQIKEKEVVDYISNVQVMEQQRRSDIVVMTVWPVGAFLLLVIIFLTIRNYRLSLQRANFQVEDVTKKSEFQLLQLERLALKIISNKNILTEVQKEIKTLKSVTSSQKTKEKINNLFNRIKVATNLADDPTDYQTFLDKTVHEFTFRLSNRFPDLTKDERNICVYIYIGLKNKQIASLTNLSLRSIENKRYRLRKKLDVESTNDLLNFLKTV